MPINLIEGPFLNIPKGIKLTDNTISYGGLTGPSYEYCSILRSYERWIEHDKIRDLWIQQASPKELFKAYRGDYKGIFDFFKMEEVFNAALGYIWSMNPELQHRYPNFDGITKLTEAQKLGAVPLSDTPWIVLGFHGGDDKGLLSIHTRENDNEDYYKHLYGVNEDGTVEYKESNSQQEVKMTHLTGRVSRKTANALYTQTGQRPKLSLVPKGPTQDK